MTNDQQDFEHFMQRRQQASRAYMNGDAAPLSEIVTRQSPATFFGPQGGAAQGAQAVWSRFEQGAALFERSSDDQFEIQHMEASDGLGYWVGFQRSTTYLRGRAEAILFNLRVTEIFRREGDAWKLIHRHADPLISEPAAKPQ